MNKPKDVLKDTLLMSLYVSATHVYVCITMVCVCSVMSDSLQPHGLQPNKLLCPWNFLGNNTGVGSHFLLQGLFLTQGLYMHLLYILHWQADSLPLSYLGSPCITILPYIFTYTVLYSVWIYPFPIPGFKRMEIMASPFSPLPFKKTNSLILFLL